MNDDIIRRSDAIEAIEEVDWYHQNRNNDMVSGANSDEHQAWYKADDIYKALESVPSADRPQKVVAQITFDEEKLREIVKEAVERFKEEYEITDRPQGEWIYTNDPLRLDDEWACSRCGNISFVKTNFCDRCGCRMRKENE